MKGVVRKSLFEILDDVINFDLQLTNMCFKVFVTKGESKYFDSSLRDNTNMLSKSVDEITYQWRLEEYL